MAIHTSITMEAQGSKSLQLSFIARVQTAWPAASVVHRDRVSEVPHAACQHRMDTGRSSRCHPCLKAAGCTSLRDYLQGINPGAHVTEIEVGIHRRVLRPPMMLRGSWGEAICWALDVYSGQSGAHDRRESELGWVSTVYAGASNVLLWYTLGWSRQCVLASAKRPSHHLNLSIIAPPT